MQRKDPESSSLKAGISHLLICPSVRQQRRPSPRIMTRAILKAVAAACPGLLFRTTLIRTTSTEFWLESGTNSRSTGANYAIRGGGGPRNRMGQRSCFRNQPRGRSAPRRSYPFTSGKGGDKGANPKRKRSHTLEVPCLWFRGKVETGMPTAQTQRGTRSANSAISWSIRGRGQLCVGPI